jgi:hypothetical protein
MPSKSTYVHLWVLLLELFEHILFSLLIAGGLIHSLLSLIILLGGRWLLVLMAGERATHIM